jgi:hypothetical protein
MLVSKSASLSHNTNCTVFGLSRLGRERMTYHSRGEHANPYPTDAGVGVHAFFLITIIKKMCRLYINKSNSYTSILLMKNITNTDILIMNQFHPMSHSRYDGKFSGTSITIIMEPLSWSITCTLNSRGTLKT